MNESIIFGEWSSDMSLVDRIIVAITGRNKAFEDLQEAFDKEKERREEAWNAVRTAEDQSNADLKRIADALGVPIEEVEEEAEPMKSGKK